MARVQPVPFICQFIGLAILLPACQAALCTAPWPAYRGARPSWTATLPDVHKLEMSIPWDIPARTRTALDLKSDHTFVMQQWAKPVTTERDELGPDRTSTGRWRPIGKDIPVIELSTGALY